MYCMVTIVNTGSPIFKLLRDDLKSSHYTKKGLITREIVKLCMVMKNNYIYFGDDFAIYPNFE